MTDNVILAGTPALIGHLTAAPKIMVEEYQAKGLTKCRVDGRIRWISGKIEEGSWLIIGMEGSMGMALLDKDNKLIHLPRDGKFQKARLKPGKEKWKLIKVSGWARTEEPVFFLDGTKWNQAGPGDLIWGHVLGESIKLAMEEI